MQHLIEDDANSPNIALGRVWLGFEDLNRHVERGSNRCVILFSGSYLLCEPKISYLRHLLRQEDVGWL